MPQLDIATFPSQIFWLAIAFSILYLVASRVTLPNMKTILSDRHQFSEGEILKADRAKDKAKKIEAEYLRAIASARQEAVGLLQETQIEMKKLLAEHENKLDLELMKMQEKSDKDFEKLRSEVSQEMQIVALEYSSKIISKLTDLDVDKTKLASQFKQHKI